MAAYIASKRGRAQLLIQIKEQGWLNDKMFSQPFQFSIAFLRDLHHVLGLRPFWSVCYLKLNFLALDQRLVPVAADGAVVDENILFTGLLDKPVALCVVKPFYLADSF